MGLRNLFRREPDDLNAELMREADTARGVPDPSPGWSDAPVDALTESVLAEIGAGRTIKAIKLYREATGVGLKEAKDVVDALAAGKALVLPPAPPAVAPHNDAAVDALIAEGELIEAIKLYRELHGVGLKEAKDAVDALRAGSSPASGAAS